MIVETILICLIGTLLHFTYEWSHHNKIVRVFSAVNESTWEHIKIALSGVFFCTLGDIFFWSSNPNYIVGKFICLLSIIIIIPILFYLYTSFTEKSYLPIDVIIFYISIIIGQVLLNTILNMNTLPNIYTYISILGIILIIILYSILSIKPLHNFIFKDPVTNKYGIEGHPCHHHHEHK